MKILPTNQTLILAAEREPSVVPLPAPGQALRSVTVVAARPDAPVLYLRADYSPPDEAAPDRTALPARAPRAPTGNAVTSRFSGGGAGPMQGFRQAALYAQTQRLPMEESLLPYVDVYA